MEPGVFLASAWIWHTLTPLMTTYCLPPLSNLRLISMANSCCVWNNFVGRAPRFLGRRFMMISGSGQSGLTTRLVRSLMPLSFRGVSS
eukprot:6481467-Pyramimonas_sp.AAC.1